MASDTALDTAFHDEGIGLATWSAIATFHALA